MTPSISTGFNKAIGFTEPVLPILISMFSIFDRAVFPGYLKAIAHFGVLDNDPILFCECCDSQFIIIDGSVSEGPANQALKKYNTYFDGAMLYITN